jgi:ABC-2 type transport system permease protein
MNRIVLVAWQDYVKYVTRRGFILGIFLFPFWIALAGVLPGFMQGTVPTRSFVVIDRDGGYRDAIGATLARSEARRSLRALAAFVQPSFDLASLEKDAPDIAALLRWPRREASLDAFIARGGWRAVVEVLVAHGLKNVAGFSPPRPRFVLEPAPDDLAAEAADLTAEAAVYLVAGKRLPDSQKLFAILFVPKGFGGEDHLAEYWSSNQADPELEGFLQAALDSELMRRAVRRLAPDPDIMWSALQTKAEIRDRDPNPAKAGAAAKGRIAQVLAAILPVGLALLLFLATFINATVLLMGVVEEKSTRMIEILLSCASPTEIMAGKLLAAIGAALTTIALWGTGLFLVAQLVWPGAAGLIAETLKSFALLPNAPFAIVYFLAGLLIYGSIFMAIGSMAASVADAQALSGPATLILMVPNFFLPYLTRDPNGLIASVASWVPVYTPYLMLFRLASHPPAYAVWGTAALSVVTAVFLVIQMGRVFAANVLTTERPPALRALITRWFGGRRAKVNRP